ncbi:MAG TPA: hypothetical protein VJ276_06045 [Thermoanaerobaculia bacterium]|nr:hypothetical protein [Thermoanaerobaculia bacterium]
MKRATALAALLLGMSLCLPAAAQLQYFGYVGADSDDALGKTKNYTNFAHVSTDVPQDPYFVARVNAINARGLKATIDLSKVFFCAPDYIYLCSDWQTRWNTWKSYNASILTSNKVLALTVRDEALTAGANLADLETAAAYIKTDATLASWLKIWWIEGACKVANDDCGSVPYNNGFNYATASIPHIDWIGLDIYGVHPASDYTFLTARTKMKQKYPGKKWMYIMDAFWAQDHADNFYPNDSNYMRNIATEWYDVARADTDAILLGAFIWADLPDEGITGTSQLGCYVQQEHTRIGRAITGKTRGLAPIGSYSIDTLGVVTGWACDRDQTVCETNPRVDIRANGQLVASFYVPAGGGTNTTNLQCGTDTAFGFKYTLPRNTQTQTITVTGVDSDTAGAVVPSTCPQAPNCSWTSHLKYYGYVGTADDTANRGLDETKGFTNFSHIAAPDDPASTFVRDRVTAMNARGIKATIDLGRVFWCGTNWRTLCVDWQSRWNTWKTTNQSILAPDKVLAMAIRDEPFNANANMVQYDQATAFVKADPLVGSWIKLWLIEAACVVASNNCGTYPGSNAWNNYTGTLPSVDWIGIDAYAIHPGSNAQYQSALTKVKNKFPSKQRMYVMDGYWDGGHATAFNNNINNMRSVAREWYDAAHNDPGAVLLGIFLWSPLSGATSSRDFPCYVLSEHREIGREITLKRRSNTASPMGKLENIYDGSGQVFGYACDPDGSLCENPVIDFYAGSTFMGSTINYPYRWDYVTNAACATGLAYRFRDTMPSNASGYSIVAKARDLDSGSVTLPSDCAENPACLWFTYNYEPRGYMENLGSNGVAAGWVCDPDAPHLSTNVRLALWDGTPIGTYPTNLNSEQAVANECNGGYVHRFSVQLPAWAHYNTIVAFAQDVISGQEVQIPWLCDPGGYECTWY